LIDMMGTVLLIYLIYLIVGTHPTMWGHTPQCLRISAAWALSREQEVIVNNQYAINNNVGEEGDCRNQLSISN